MEWDISVGLENWFDHVLDLEHSSEIFANGKQDASNLEHALASQLIK